MKSYLDDGDVQLYQGSAADVLRGLSCGVQTVVTSPPYWGLRDYAASDQIGLETTPDAYVGSLVAIFAEIRRVLRDDGTVWLNLGDSYSHGGNGARDPERWPKQSRNDHRITHPNKAGPGPKQLVGIPWRVAFALQADGWYLRSDIIWSKPNPMPESVRDRPTKAHEYLFLLSKQPRYFYDADAIAEDADPKYESRYNSAFGGTNTDLYRRPSDNGIDMRTRMVGIREFSGKRNARTVWNIAIQPTREAHFATYPEMLVERCLKAGSREGDVVLDPFIGSGTTALVARRLGRRCVGIDINEDYLKIAAKRTQQLSLLAEEATA